MIELECSVGWVLKGSEMADAVLESFEKAESNVSRVLQNHGCGLRTVWRVFGRSKEQPYQAKSLFRQE